MLSIWHAIQVMVPVALYLYGFYQSNVFYMNGVYIPSLVVFSLCLYFLWSTLFFVCIMDNCYQRSGRKWPAFQNLTIWKYLVGYFDGGITVEEKLDNNQQYIFCSFPHGACECVCIPFSLSFSLVIFISFR